jgi:hypothetical protein
MMDEMRVALLGSLLLVLAGCAPPPAPPDPALWGSLKPGPYAVGFGLRWETDPSRVYGLEKDGVTKKPRPIPVGVWYPARSSPAEHMQVADYFDMRSKQVQFDELANRLNGQIRGALAQSLGDPSAVNRFLAMRAGATFDAPPAKGQFPVVIYGSDVGYEEDFVLFEYLASQGYVVLSSSYHSSHPTATLPIRGPDPAGVQRRGPGDWYVRERDMLFLHRFASMLGNADPAHIAALGYGAGGEAVMWWAMEEDTPLDGVATLDSSQGFSTIFGAVPPEGPATPSLQFAPPLRDVSDPQNGPHFRVIVPGLRHDDFVTTGIVREASRPHRDEYDRLCRLTLLFFDAYLKKSPAALAELKQSLK